VCLSVCLSVCLPACLSACLPACLSVCLSACMCVCVLGRRADNRKYSAERTSCTAGETAGHQENRWATFEQNGGGQCKFLPVLQLPYKVMKMYIKHLIIYSMFQKNPYKLQHKCLNLWSRNVVKTQQEANLFFVQKLCVNSHHSNA